MKLSVNRNKGRNVWRWLRCVRGREGSGRKKGRLKIGNSSPPPKKWKKRKAKLLPLQKRESWWQIYLDALERGAGGESSCKRQSSVKISRPLDWSVSVICGARCQGKTGKASNWARGRRGGARRGKTCKWRAGEQSSECFMAVSRLLYVL